MANIAGFLSEGLVGQSISTAEEVLWRPGFELSEVGKNITFASWDKAVSQLKEELKRSDSKKTNRTLEKIPHGDFKGVLEAAKKAAEKTASKRFRSTETIQRVIDSINKYAVIGDLIVQHHAEYTSLVWGAFRFILLAAVEEGKIEMNLSASLDQVLQVLLRTQEYSTSFSYYSGYENVDLFQGLQDNVTQLYERVLKFLVRAVEFFEERTIKRYAYSIVSPFETKFKPLMEDIRVLEMNIEKAVATLDRAYRVRQENFSWLQTVDYSSDIAKINKECLKGTCEWFFHLEEFQRWNEDASGSNLLWIQGKPGCGKSTIAARIATSLQAQPGQVIVSVFCKEKDERKGKLESILQAIISQILSQSKNSLSLHSLVQSYRIGAHTVHPNQALLWALLRDILSTFHGLQCVIDGLDECEASETERLEFLNKFNELFKPSDALVRPHKAVILSRLDFVLTEVPEMWICVAIVDSNTYDDIKLFVEHALSSSKKLSTQPKRHELFQYLTENASGMILWAKLMLAELEMGYRNRDRVLSCVPKGLTEVYKSILTRFSQSETLTEWDRILTMLSIVSTASKPLTLRELAVALAFWDNFSKEHLQSPDDIDIYEVDEVIESIALAAPLLVVTPTRTVEMTHTSLTQFLLGAAGKNFMSSQVGHLRENINFDEGNLHYQMTAMICRYLSSRKLHTALDSGEETATINQLLEYACRHLIHHATRSSPLANVMSVVLRYFGSEHGWRWLHILRVRMNLTQPELQIIQSQFRNILAAETNAPNSSPMYNLLIFLSRQRYEHYVVTRPCEDENRLSSAQNLVDMLALEGYWYEATQLQLEVFEIREKTLGIGHERVIISMSKLASLYAEQGLWSEAESLSARLLDQVSRLYTPEHHRVLMSKNNLAVYKGNVWKFNEAQALHEEVLEMRRKNLGPDNPETILSVNNLKTLYSDHGKRKEAERLEDEIKNMLDKNPSLLDKHENLVIVGNTARYYSRMGDYVKAEELATRAVATAQKILGPDHPETIFRQDELANIYGDQHRYEESEKLHKYVLDARRRVQGMEHYSTLQSLHNTGISLRTQGKLSEAEKMLDEAVESRKKLFGDTDPSTLSSKISLALVWQKQGRNKEAEKLLEEVQSKVKEFLNYEHPIVLECGAILSLVKNELAKYDEAIELQRHIVEIQTRNYGNDHEVVWRLKHNLSVYLHNSGNIEESMLIGKDVLEARMSKLGPDHPDVLDSKHSMIVTYELEGDLAKAEALAVESLEVSRKKLGNDHTTTLLFAKSLGRVYHAQGRLDLAETLGQEVLATWERVFGALHPTTCICMVELANYYKRQGKYKEALELGERGLQCRKQSTGPDHPRYFIHMVHQGRILRYLSRLDEAETLTVQALNSHKRFCKVEGSDTTNLDVLKAMSWLASIYHDQERFKEAEQLRRKVLDGKRLVLGNEHWESLAAMSRLAQTYSKDERKLSNAEKLALEAAALQEQKLGAKHPARLFSLSVLASICLEQGKIQDAIRLQQQVVEGRRDVLGSSHPETERSLAILETYKACQV